MTLKGLKGIRCAVFRNHAIFNLNFNFFPINVCLFICLFCFPHFFFSLIVRLSLRIAFIVSFVFFVDVKQLWDFVSVIESCVSNWKKTAWKRLDVEEIEQQSKKFSKDIRLLGKQIREWQPFVYIERVLKNLVTSLRAITELQNAAIKDRHWLELMKSTGVMANIYIFIYRK